MPYDSVSPRLVISPRQVRWNKNALILNYLVKKSEDGSGKVEEFIIVII